MRLYLKNCTVVAMAALMLVLPTKVRADAVTDWNAIAVGATAVPPGRPGPSMVLDMAAVHGAIYDAVQAIENDYVPYCTELPGASGTPAAAVAKAAHDVLVHRFPAQTGSLDLAYQNYLINNGIPSIDAGIPVGEAAATCMNNLRENDGSFPASYPPFFGSEEIGVWRSATPMAAPWLGFVTTYTMKSPSQFRPKPPPKLNSPEYTRAYNEVKNLGAKTDSSRTTEQTDLANFWNLAYPSVWHRELRELSTAHVDNISDSSRLFAFASMSMADAIIAAWDAKSAYVFWRPSTAIYYGDDDPNPKTDGDITWLPLVSDPPYPDYTSGANNISAAATRSLSLFFGTNEFTFEILTTNTGPTVDDTRTFHKFSEVRDEVVEARIYEGIHFRFADQLARRQGEHIAQWAHGHYFRPVE